MPVPPEARPFRNALARVYQDGLRAEDACLRACELVILESGSPPLEALLVDVREVLEGNKSGFDLPEIHLVLARSEVERLVALSPGERRKRISQRRSLRGPAFGEALLERARAALPADPRDSGSWGECAVHAMTYTEQDDPAIAKHVASCLARGLAFWGNSLRILCDLRQAKSLIGQADRIIEDHAIGDLATRAEIASFRGSLLRAQREFDAARSAIEVSLAGWDLVGRPDRQARELWNLASVHVAEQSPTTALEVAEVGSRLAEDLNDRRLAWSFELIEAHCLIELDQIEPARRAADAARQLAADFPDSFTQLRVRWLEGRLCRSEGRPDEAIDHFRAVQTGFLADQNPYDAALVSLDLATLYLETGRHAEVVELATAMRAAFEALGVHREALAAWRLFTDACQRQAANVQLAKNLARYLDQARHDPEFGFSATGVFG